MDIINPFLRSTTYKILSSFYTYPEKQTLDEMNNRNQEISTTFDALSSQGNFISSRNIRGFFSSLDSFSLKEVQTEYVRLFDYRPLCPVYESSYVTEGRRNPAEVQLFVEDCYNEFGLDSSQSYAEPPDHIILELEFMHFLSFKEGEAFGNEDKGEKKYLMAEKKFCENHLLRWVPNFCSRLNESSNLPFFQTLAVLTKDFILEDANHINTLCKNLQ